MKKAIFKKPTVIWAIDPVQNPTHAKSIVKELQTWAKRLNWDVQPMAVISKSDLNFPTDTDHWSRIEDAARIAANTFVKKTGARGFKSADVLMVDHSSTRKFAADLGQFAETSGAIMVAANTRAKKSWMPIHLGSFAETLAGTCRVPLLLINPKAKPSAKIPSILFPTDFSKESRNALHRLTPWAAQLDSDIILFNQIERPYIYPEINGTGMLLSLEDSLEEMQKNRARRARQWANHLVENGVNCSAVVQRERRSIQVEILELAKKNKVELIAMVNHSAALTQAVLGSVARDVLLQAGCPVLIFYRPKSLSKVTTRSNKIKTRKISKTNSNRLSQQTDGENPQQAV